MKPLAETRASAPDFASLYAVSSFTADQRTNIHIIVGSLVVAWANNESLLAHMIAALMRVDKATATVVFATIGSTRGRIELVERLVILKIKDIKLATEIRDALKDFTRCTAVRNEFNHCIYGLGSDGSIIHTQGTRIKESIGGLDLDCPKPFNDERIKQLSEILKSMTLLNRTFWSIIARIRCLPFDKSDCE